LGSITINSVTGGITFIMLRVLMGFMTKKFFESDWASLSDVVDFGLYQIIITDANGLLLLKSNILISPPSDLDISVTPVGPSCAGLGSAEIAMVLQLQHQLVLDHIICSIQSRVNLYGITTLWYDEDAMESKKLLFEFNSRSYLYFYCT
jgi:hypothetical protein